MLSKAPQPTPTLFLGTKMPQDGNQALLFGPYQEVKGQVFASLVWAQDHTVYPSTCRQDAQFSFAHFGLLLIISSVVGQGQRFAFSPGPLQQNWVIPLICPQRVYCGGHTDVFKKKFF